MKDFSREADIFQFEGALPFLKKRGWALLNVALWWKQYIGNPATTPSYSGQISLGPRSLDQSLPLVV